MSKQPVWTGSPVQDAPYTPGIIAGEMLFVSGQVPMDPNTKAIVKGDFEARVSRCILNVEAVLKAGGAALEDVVKTTVFLTNMDDFAELNRVYGKYFGDVKPARSCVQVTRLPMDVDVEIEAIALRK